MEHAIYIVYWLLIIYLIIFYFVFYRNIRKEMIAIDLLNDKGKLDEFMRYVEKRMLKLKLGSPAKRIYEMNYAVCTYYKGDFKKAEEMLLGLEKYFNEKKLKNVKMLFYNNLAYLYVDSQELSKAKKIFEENIINERANTNSRRIKSMDTAHYKMLFEDKNEGKRELVELLKKVKKRFLKSIVSYRVALVEIELGNKDEAIRILESIHEILKETFLYEKIENLLGELKNE